MELLVVRIISLVAIALIYMIFDVFNKRDVPSVFAYAAIAYGFVLTILYFNIDVIAASIGLCAAILGLGYIVYRIGQLGAGDVFELATLSLVLPFFGAPLLMNIPQFGLPFIVALFVDTGIVALILVPLYYIPKSISSSKRPILSFVKTQDIVKSILVGIAYMIFLAFVIIVLGVRISGLVLLLAIMIGSIAVILFESPITNSMVDYVDYRSFEEGDIIALNLMAGSDVNRIRKRVRGFERLVTRKLIEEMKQKRIREKVPVYKRAIPFAVPIFIALVLSILLGNIILFLLPV